MLTTLPGVFALFLFPDPIFRLQPVAGWKSVLIPAAASAAAALTGIVPTANPAALQKGELISALLMGSIVGMGVVLSIGVYAFIRSLSRRKDRWKCNS